MLVVETIAKIRRMHFGQRINPDQELVALGAVNLGASLTGGFPVTGGFARSVVNFDVGAETPAAGAFPALGLALVDPRPCHRRPVACPGSLRQIAAPQSLSTLIVGMEAKGYQGLDVDLEGSWMEADAITKYGRPVELIVAARSGEITHEGVDD